ncbi:MAG: MFS transporter [Alphaproteobacteria bacterium]
MSVAAISGRAFRVRLVGAACLAGAVSLLLRSSLGILGPDLMREFSIGAEALGLLAGVFFITFAALQLPLGILLDRVGPRRVVAGGLAVAALGCFVFATASGFSGLLAGRIVMGAGCAGLMIGGFVLLSRWFAAADYARASSILVAFGNTGTLIATAPLGLAAVWLGWRGAFHVIGVVAVAVVVLVLLVQRDAPPGHALHERETESMSDSLRGILDVLRNRRMPYLLGMALVGYPVIASVLALWGGPYLNDVHGLDTVARSNVMLGMALAVMAAPLFWAALVRVIGLRRTVLAGAGTCFTALALLAAIPEPGLWLAAALLLLLGASGGYSMLLLAIAREIFPDHLTGRAMTMVNVAVVGGVSVMQIATGFVVGAFPLTGAGLAPPDAYRTLFAVLALAVATGAAVFSRMGPLPGEAAGARE